MSDFISATEVDSWLRFQLIVKPEQSGKTFIMIKEIINGGSKWSNFFDELEKVTPTDIQIKTLSIQGNQITMDLVGKDVTSIDRFIKSFSTFKVKTEPEKTVASGDNKTTTSQGKNLFENVDVSGYSAKDDGNVILQAKMNLVEGLLW